MLRIMGISSSWNLSGHNIRVTRPKCRASLAVSFRHPNSSSLVWMRENISQTSSNINCNKIIIIIQSIKALLLNASSFVPGQLGDCQPAIYHTDFVQFSVLTFMCLLTSKRAVSCKNFTHYIHTIFNLWNNVWCSTLCNETFSKRWSNYAQSVGLAHDTLLPQNNNIFGTLLFHSQCQFRASS
jgi:hypothetical protein